MVAFGDRGCDRGTRGRRARPQLIESASWPYVALGAGYAIASLAMFGLGAMRARAVDRALSEGAYSVLPDAWVLVLCSGGAALALGTLLVVLFA